MCNRWHHCYRGLRLLRHFCFRVFSGAKLVIATTTNNLRSLKVPSLTLPRRRGRPPRDIPRERLDDRVKFVRLLRIVSAIQAVISSLLEDQFTRPPFPNPLAFINACSNALQGEAQGWEEELQEEEGEIEVQIQRAFENENAFASEGDGQAN